MNAKYSIARSWDVVLAVVAAAAAGRWLPSSVIKEVTTELIAFFAIQSAAVLPAMIFTAGLLRGDGLTLAEIDRYQMALRRQMYFWATLLFLDLLATGIVIVGKAADWKWKITVSDWTEDFGWLMIALTTFITTWAVLRMVPFVRGVISLVDLNGMLAKKALQARLAEKSATDLPASSFEPPEGYGQIVTNKRRLK
jgi:hypothetical protein